MKILYIANARIPTEKAHGVQIMKMCEAFARHGHTIVLMVPWRFNRIKDNAFDYYGIAKNFSIVRVPSLDFVALGSIGFFVQRVSFVVFALLLLLSRRFDVMYSRDILACFLLTALSSKRCAYEDHEPMRRRSLYRWLLNMPYPKVLVAPLLARLYVSLGVPVHNTIAAPNGVDLGEFRSQYEQSTVKEKLGLSSDKPVVMYIGRVDAWKGVETLAKVSEIAPEIQIVIVGEGPQLALLKKRYPKATFTGFLPYRDLARNQQAADILVVPNTARDEVSKYYTSPLKIFAHMASGVPIIASNIPSIAEILNKTNAFLVPPDDPQALGAAIQQILTGSEEAQKRATQAKSDVRKHSWSARAEKIAAFLETQS